MPYEAPGRRHSAVATKQCVHGAIVVEDNVVGSAFKVEQLAWNITGSATQQIDVGEEFEIQVGGIHETTLEGDIATADVGSLIFIAEDDNGLTTTSAEGLLPVGVVTALDESRTPAAVRINSNAWNAFAAVPAAI